MNEKTFGVITTWTGRIPNFSEAVETDLEMGSHNLNNAASEEFSKKYPSVLAVGLAYEHEFEKQSAWISIAIEALQLAGKDHSAGCECKICQCLQTYPDIT